MKKWYYWFYLSLGFAVGGIVNYFDGKQIVAAIIQVSFTVTLAIVQFVCDKKGERIFKYIGMIVAIALIIWIIFFD